MEACPADKTNRSRFGQMGAAGSKRNRRFQSQYPTGAKAIGVPGWPELAACTASIAKVRIVLMQSWSCESAVDFILISYCYLESLSGLIVNSFMTKEKLI